MRRSAWVVVALAVVSGGLSCGGATARDPVAPTPAPAGARVATTVVRDAAGQAIPAAVVAVYTSPGGAPVAVARADAQGVVSVAVPEGTFAVGVAGPSAVGWLPELDAVPPMIGADTPCVQVSGEVAVAGGGAVGAAVVHLMVFTEPFPTYPALVERGGRFALCVPGGVGMAFTSGDLTAIPQRVVLAAGARLRVSAYRRTEIERTSDAAVEPGDLEAFVRDIPAGARVVGIGEANHGTAEFVETRRQLAVAMSATAPTIVMLEAGVAEAMVLDAYAQGGQVDLAKAIRDLGYWMWNTVEFRGFLDALRAHNGAHPGTTIRVLGFDVQDTQAACDLLLATASLTSSERALLERLAPERGRGVLAFTSVDADQLDALLARLAAIKLGDGLDATPNRGALAALELTYRLATLRSDAVEGQRQRDVGMARVVAAVASLAPQARILALAHNGHLGREPYSTVPSMGEALHAQLGAAYYPVGLFSVAGEAWAWNPAGTRREAVPLTAAPLHSLEATLTRSSPDRPMFVHLRAAPRELQAWMALPRYVREFGSQAGGDASDFVVRSIPRAFDAVIVVPHGHATTPLPAPGGG